jgi:hypothetical protein
MISEFISGFAQQEGVLHNFALGRKSDNTAPGPSESAGVSGFTRRQAGRGPAAARAMGPRALACQSRCPARARRRRIGCQSLSAAAADSDRLVFRVGLGLIQVNFGP